MLVPNHKTTWYITENHNPGTHCCENSNLTQSQSALSQITFWAINFKRHEGTKKSRSCSQHVNDVLP